MTGHEIRARRAKVLRIARQINRLNRLGGNTRLTMMERAILVRSMTPEQFASVTDTAYANYAPHIHPTPPSDKTRRAVVRWFTRRAGR